MGQELSLGNKYSSSRPAAVLKDTVRPTVAGAGRHRGWDTARALAERITTPLLPDDYLKLANPLWSARELRGRVLDVHRETVDSATMVIKPGWGFSFDYQPGQYMGIGVLVDGRWRWRSYSLTSSPAAGAAGRRHQMGSRTITIKSGDARGVPHDLSGRRVAPGTIVRLAAPQALLMPDPAPASLLFITAGSGITPVMSMLRTLARREQVTDVVHLHSAPTESDVMFAAELAKMQTGYEGYRLRLRSTRAEGRLDLSRLGDEVPDWRERQTWACGPEGMLNDAERVWTAAGIDEQLHLERFAVSKAAAHGQGGTVQFARSQKTVTVDGATPLMDAGEGVGIQMPFGCRMGICQSCVVSLLDGHVRDLRTGAEHEPGSRVQTCISAASGDCVLDV
jgi:ferredoxin-NADP reductase